VALSMVLSQKLRDEKLFVIELPEKSDGKTSSIYQILKSVTGGKIAKNTLVVLSSPSVEFKRSIRNIPAVNMCSAKDLNVFDAAKARTIYITRPALEELISRLS
jgi:ribosomal protein L4